MGVRFVGGVSA